VYKAVRPELASCDSGQAGMPAVRRELPRFLRWNGRDGGWPLRILMRPARQVNLPAWVVEPPALPGFGDARQAGMPAVRRTAATCFDAPCKAGEQSGWAGRNICPTGLPA